MNVNTTPLPASAVAAMQAARLKERTRQLRIEAQARFNETGLPRYAYSTRMVTR